MALSKHRDCDFIDWDDSDLDLEEIGAETDRELELEAEWSGASSDTDGDRENRQPAQSGKSKRSSTQRKATQQKRPCTRNEGTSFKCPECSKVLKTVAGFRGHTQKHGLHVRAEHHKTENSTTKSAHVAAPEKNLFLDTENQIKQILDICIPEALSAIENDPFNAVSRRKQVEQLAGATKTARENLDLAKLTDFLALHLISVIGPLKWNISMAAGREEMWAQFHKLRFDLDFTSELCTYMGTDASLPLANIFLENLLEKVIAAQVTMLKDSVENDTQSELCSDSDMKVLFYVAGYLIHALSKQYRKFTNSKYVLLGDAVELLKDSPAAEKHQYLKKHKSWAHRLDRGGLKSPADEFFLLVRQLDILSKKSVRFDEATSVNRLQLTEIIMDDFLVKHYAHRLLSSCEAHIQANVTEHLVQVFLKVRGHAMAKHVQRRVQKQSKKAKNKRGAKASLRKSLRDYKN